MVIKTIISLIKKLGEEVSNKKYLLSKLNNEHSIDIAWDDENISSNL